MSFRSLLTRQLGRRRPSPLVLQQHQSPSLAQLRAFAASTTSNVSRIKNTPHLKRKLGQHLLVNEKILTQIVDAAQIPLLLQSKQQSAGANAPDVNDATVLHILEIGPGTGNLTSALLNASPQVQVHAIEYDTRMVERLSERFKDMQHRLTIKQKDFEEFEFASHQLQFMASDQQSDDGEADEEDDGSDDSDEDSSVSRTAKRRRASGRTARKLARLTKKSLEKEERKASELAQAQASRVHFDACVANIPYQLSSIIISRLSNYMHKFPTHFKCAVLLVQEEFALRLLAKYAMSSESTEFFVYFTYGSLTIMIVLSLYTDLGTRTTAA